jgi:hypothetical protein
MTIDAGIAKNEQSQPSARRPRPPSRAIPSRASRRAAELRAEMLQPRHHLITPSEGRFAIVTDVGRGMRWTRQRQVRNVMAGRVSP